MAILLLGVLFKGSNTSFKKWALICLIVDFLTLILLKSNPNF